MVSKNHSHLILIISVYIFIWFQESIYKRNYFQTVIKSTISIKY